MPYKQKELIYAGLMEICIMLYVNITQTELQSILRTLSVVCVFTHSFNNYYPRATWQAKYTTQSPFLILLH